jgi:hypothetical protein
MGLMSRLFGYEGTVRFEFETVSGEKFTGKVKIECWGVDRAQLEEKLKNSVFVETGKRVKSLRILAAT